MKYTKIIIAGIVGLIIGVGIMVPVARYQYEKRQEVVFYLDAIIKFIDDSPECKEAIEKL